MTLFSANRIICNSCYFCARVARFLSLSTWRLIRRKKTVYYFLAWFRRRKHTWDYEDRYERGRAVSWDFQWLLRHTHTHTHTHPHAYRDYQLHPSCFALIAHITFSPPPRALSQCSDLSLWLRCTQLTSMQSRRLGWASRSLQCRPPFVKHLFHIHIVHRGREK
jgi:hypothetical protein